MFDYNQNDLAGYLEKTDLHGMTSCQMRKKSIKAWIEQNINVPGIAMPRCFVSPNKVSPINQIHCICNASQLAFRADIYIRSQSANTITTGFAIARAKVAPLKQISIPKIELQASALGCSLLQFVSKQLTIPVTSRHFWATLRPFLPGSKAKKSLKLLLQIEYKRCETTQMSPSASI